MRTYAKSTHPTGDEPENMTHVQKCAHQHMAEAEPRTHNQFGFHPYKAYEAHVYHTQTIQTH